MNWKLFYFIMILFCLAYFPDGFTVGMEWTLVDRSKLLYFLSFWYYKDKFCRSFSLFAPALRVRL